MDEDQPQPATIDSLNAVFREALIACLEACAHGRRGLFSARHASGDEPEQGWPEAERLRELAAALQSIAAQNDEPNPLCDEFIDLCTIHGENDPGEARLARAFLARIEKGEVGSPTQKEQKPWQRGTA